MDELIAKLEAATGPDRNLDAEIAVACCETTAFVERLGKLDEGWVSKGPHHAVVPAPEYTASIDAALTLLPELTNKNRPLKIVLGISESGLRFACSIESWLLGAISSGRRPNWPIALSIAALKARQHQAK